MELIGTAEMTELIRSELNIKRIHAGQISRYRDAGWIYLHSGKVGKQSARYDRDEVLANIKYIQQYRSRNKLRGSKSTLKINVKNGCNLFIILMNKRLING